MATYYNEHDPHAAAWLRALITAGHLPAGEVDERSIVDVAPADLRGFRHCHFFAGIGGWPLALRLAGWPDDVPTWTGSCPCQPWSVANLWHNGGRGAADARHLWPAWFRLISQRHPAVIFGEQIPAAVRRGWWDDVRRDLETAAYACGGAVLPASAVGAEHERKRFYWVADTSGPRWEGHQPITGLSQSAAQAHSINGDVLVRAGHILAGDRSDLLPCDGLSVVLERNAIRGYGNAIVPQAAAAFIESYLMVMADAG